MTKQSSEKDTREPQQRRVTEYSIAMGRDKVKSTRLTLIKTTTEVLSLVTGAELHILKHGRIDLTDPFK